QAALAGLDAVPVYESQGVDLHQPRRRHRRRAADRRHGRPRRTPPHRFVLRPDHPDLDGIADGVAAGGCNGLWRRHGGAYGSQADGQSLMKRMLAIAASGLLIGVVVLPVAVLDLSPLMMV